MCVVSGVYDHFYPRIPDPLPQVQPQINWQINQQPIDLVELRTLIEEFKEALKAAKTVDRLTGQPDCADPEKAKLEKRVALLEKQIEQMKRLRTKESKRQV